MSKVKDTIIDQGHVEPRMSEWEARARLFALAKKKLNGEQVNQHELNKLKAITWKV